MIRIRGFLFRYFGIGEVQGLLFNLTLSLQIGRPYSDAELHALMVSKHGKNVGKATLTKNLPKAKADIVDKSALVIENPEMLKATNGVTTNGIHAHGDSASKTQVLNTYRLHATSCHKLQKIKQTATNNLTPLFKFSSLCFFRWCNPFCGLFYLLRQLHEM